MENPARDISHQTSSAVGGGGAFLTVENDDFGSTHTYIYEPDRSFRHLTLDALPQEKNYEPGKLGDIMAASDLQRPTIEELMAGQKGERKEEEKEPVDPETLKGKVVKYGWLEGVFMRCLLNIWGTMLFLRLTWVVGQAGIIQGLICVSLCNVVTALSAISMSAIATNGQIAAGGVYYMISRSLGPALGGSIGLMFMTANTISMASYTIGFADSLLDLLADIVPNWDGIVVPQAECSVAGCRDNDVRIICASSLCLFLFIAFAGMSWVTRVQKMLLFLLIMAQIDMLLGSFIDIEFGTCYADSMDDGYKNIDQEQRHAYGYTGWSLDTADENLLEGYRVGPMNSDPEEKASFVEVFGVFFTAVTGIVAGANLSGNLKDPAAAIPKGTLGAIAVTYCTYMYFAVQTGFTMRRETSGVKIEYQYWEKDGFANTLTGIYNLTEANQNISNTLGIESELYYPRVDACTPSDNYMRDQLKAYFASYNDLETYKYWTGTEKGCLHGSAMDQMTMTYVSFTGYLRYAGGFSASISSAIACLEGAPRVLQAVGKDRLYPGVSFFARGYTANNDPYRAYLLVFFIAMGFAMLATLNGVSVIASNFFLAAYALMNLSCFHSSITKAPSWRPSYTWYNPWVSLFSTFLCILMMFAMDWYWAVGTIAITITLGLYIFYRNPEANWGSSTQGQIFVNAVQAVHTLTETPDHVKNYRPKILLMTGNPAHRPALVDFANLITKKVSLLVCGHVIQGGLQINGATLKSNVQMWLKDHSIRGFYLMNQACNFEEGSRNCIAMAGLGKLSPNMLIMGFKSDWKESLNKGPMSSSEMDTREYMATLICALDYKLSVAILRVRDGFDYSSVIAAEKQLTCEVEIRPENADVDAQGPNALVPGKVKTKKVSTAVYHGYDGMPLPKKYEDNIKRFENIPSKKRDGTIDVWWLYDDGGLTLLLPYILTTRNQFKNCKVRVFCLANRADQLDKETRQMATLLTKFRINYSDVIAIPDVGKKAESSTKEEFANAIMGANIDLAERDQEKERTNRHLRLAELLRQHSKESELIVMTMPLPRRQTNPALYMAWLDVMTRDLPPILLTRGNQVPVLTFYS